MADYLFLDATGSWSVPTKTKYKYLRADNTWAAPDPNYKFLRADGKWEQMILGPKLGEVEEGTLIKYLTFLGAKVVWRAIGNNLAGMPSGSTTLFMDKIIALRCFDASEPKDPLTGGSGRYKCGNNDWALSNLRQWMNSSARSWYKAQHEYDGPPDTVAHCGNASMCYPYQSKPGMLYSSSAEERNLAMTTTRRYGRGPATYSSYYPNNSTCDDKFFLLTSTEIGIWPRNDDTDGTNIPYFDFSQTNSTRERRKAECTAECLEEDGGSYNPATHPGYWLATGTIDSDIGVMVANSSTGDEGTRPGNTAYANYGWLGVRGACNLPSTTQLSPEKDSDGCYTLVL